MGIWQNIQDGFFSGLMGKGPNYVKKQRAKQVREERMRQAGLLRDRLDAVQAALDEKNAIAEAAGQRHRYKPYARSGFLNGVPVIVQLYGNNDPTKIDVYYGGEGVPDGPGHGHITMRKGVIDTWYLPADAKGRRERIV